MIKRIRTSGVSKAINAFMHNADSNQPLIQKSQPLDYTIKVANTLEERQAVFKLGYKVYLEKNYTKKNESEMLIRDFDFLEETVILMATDKNQKVVGSVTLVFKSNIKLPAEENFKSEVGLLANKGNKIAEISRFVIESEYRHSRELLVLLFNYLAIYTHLVKKYNTLIIECTPRHKEYYKKLLCFDELSIPKPCHQVNGTIGVLLTLSSDTYVYALKNINHPKIQKTLYPYFLQPEQVNLVAFYLSKNATPISIIEKEYFMSLTNTFKNTVTA